MVAVATLKSWLSVIHSMLIENLGGPGPPLTDPPHFHPTCRGTDLPSPPSRTSPAAAVHPRRRARRSGRQRRHRSSSHVRRSEQRRRTLCMHEYEYEDSGSRSEDSGTTTTTNDGASRGRWPRSRPRGTHCRPRTQEPRLQWGVEGGARGKQESVASSSMTAWPRRRPSSRSWSSPRTDV